MSQSSNPSNSPSSKDRIPANKTERFTAWELPEVKQGQIVAVEKLKKRGPRGELVNVKEDEVIYSTMTAGQLNELTQQAYDEVRQQAYEEGARQGREEGYQTGLEEGREAVQQQIKQLQNTLHSLHNVLEGQDDELEQALVNLTMCIARSVLKHEISLDQSHIQQVIKQAVDALPLKEDRLVIHLNPAEYQLLTGQDGIPEQWTLQSDPGVSAGGCRVVSPHSVVDFTLEEQFQQVINNLVETRFAELAKQAQQRESDAAGQTDSIDQDSIDQNTDS